MHKDNYCPNGKHYIGLTDIYCKECGSKLRWYKWICTTCKNDIEFDIDREPKYCPRCGNPTCHRVELDEKI